MGPFSEELQYKRAEAIERLLKNNPQLDAITKSMWEQKLKGLCYDEDSYNAVSYTRLTLPTSSRV